MTAARREVHRFPFSVVVAAAGLAALGWLRVERLWEPTPLPLIYLGWHIAGVPERLWVLTGPLLLVVWSPQLLVGSPRIPIRSLGGLALFSVFAIWHAWASWDYTVAYRGWFATTGILALATSPLVLLWALYFWARQQPRFWSALLFHFGLCAWLAVLAFPDTIELP